MDQKWCGVGKSFRGGIDGTAREFNLEHEEDIPDDGGKHCAHVDFSHAPFRDTEDH